MLSSLDQYDLILDIDNAEKIATLHNKILEFDNTLANIEHLLGAFKFNLSSISSEIQSLQADSVSMALKLKNRQAVRGELSQLIDEVAVSDELS
ncbi:unnamed protein product, partial [Soboliphyme baturini]|uniref:Vacuolar protein sorting-associated protein 52 homolog n=1 Tax=Soboliphyme baturini TaxID=241478 RepID=A0A183IAA3_9BILA